MNNIYRIPCPKTFSLSLCLDCGQAFRWTNKDNIWQGVAYGKYIEIEQTENEIIFYNCTEKDFKEIWAIYFDLDCDYEKILSSYDDKHLKTAVSKYDGIRILRQEPWEALCSFIISQNNNIPRIKGIIHRLCEEFGDGESGKKSFPTAERLSKLTAEDLAPLRAGFRAKYIIDAAQKVTSGKIDFNKIQENPIDFGREELQKIKGVGAKVAECTLLYGFHKIDAFPVDVWVKRIMAEMYPNGLPKCTKGTEGIAQQYLFHWRRMQDR
ncbi:MAG: DNA-3-methyladenine glycosylase 2 [Clostridia bacterium]|nr:DNA-3-methyladenine glycosylase 2 [Clostridia bacterium]